MNESIVNKKIYLSPKNEFSKAINELFHSINKIKKIKPIRIKSGKIFLKENKIMRKESNLSQPNLINRYHKKN